MELNLIDKLILLALDDEKGSFSESSVFLGYGLAGAILLELTKKEKIKISNKKIAVLSSIKTGDMVLDPYLELITNSKKEKSLSHWIHTFTSKSTAIKDTTLNKLIQKGILIKEEKKFLWVFTLKKYPTKNPLPEHKLRIHLNKIIANTIKPEIDDMMLISLIDSCTLSRATYGKENAKKYKNNIKTIIESANAHKEINATVKEIQHEIEAIMVIIISSAVTTTIIN